MKSVKKDHGSIHKLINRGDPFSDRRSGEDRRVTYSLMYFMDGNPCRRGGEVERRTNQERRAGYVRVSEWSSVCPVHENTEDDDGYINIKM